MTKQELLEIFTQHHPNMGEIEILRYVNKALKTFGEDTKMVDESFYDTTVANQRFYELPDGTMDVTRVTLTDGDGKHYSIPRSLGIPKIEDKDFT